MTTSSRWLSLAALLLAFGGCGGSKESPESAPAARVSKSVTFTQITIGYRGFPGVTRGQEEARALATSLIERIQRGESMDRLLAEFTDDRGEDGKPFNGGSYTKSPNDPLVHPAIREVVFSLKVGALHPKPIDSGFAFHVIRRDA